MEEKTKAMSGIGTLIIFIALILVASVAAFVILQTAGTLQSQAIATGSESRTEVATKVFLVNILGETQNQSEVNKIRIVLKLAPGSDPVTLTHSYLHYSDGNVYETAVLYLDPNETYYDNNAPGVSQAANNSTHFTAHYLRRPSDYPANLRTTVTPDDIIELYYKVNPVGPNTRIFLQFIGDRGSPTPAEFKIPQNLDANAVALFP